MAAVFSLLAKKWLHVSFTTNLSLQLRIFLSRLTEETATQAKRMQPTARTHVVVFSATAATLQTSITQG